MNITAPLTSTEYAVETAETPEHFSYDFPAINPKKLGKVAVLMGGNSGERDISLLSGNGVLNALKSVGVDAVVFDPATQSFAELLALNVDRAMLCLHGRYGEDGCIQGALELLNIPYTGSGVLASSIAMDKIMTKRLWLGDGLSTPDYRLVRSEAELLAAQTRLGEIAVKPVREGSSLGFSHVKSASDVPAAWATSLACAPEALAETFITGRELTVAILKTSPTSPTQALPIVEIHAPQGNYDYQNKYFTDDVRYEAPAKLSAELTAKIQHLAVQAFDSVGCQGWGRVDVMLHTNESGHLTPYLLEVNTTPGMTGHSLVPMAAKVVGLEYPQLCCLLASTAALKT
jgi:D-alanine-D-alanine ligase